MQSEQKYYVYENWVAEGHKVRIHRASCSFCNNGRGIHNTDSTRNGRWHGPFSYVEDIYRSFFQVREKISKC